MRRDQRRVTGRVDDELVVEPLGVGEAQRAVDEIERDALVVEALGPEDERLLGADAVDDPVHHARAGPAGDRARVLEEGQVGAGGRFLVAVEEVVDAGIVLVDGLRGQPEAQDARVEVDVAAGVAGDRADVVDAFESHVSSPQRLHQQL